jgi:hypothetical protein
MPFREQHCVLLSSTSCCKCRNNRPSYSSLTQWNLCSHRMDCSWFWCSPPRHRRSPKNVVWKVWYCHLFGDLFREI